MMITLMMIMKMIKMVTIFILMMMGHGGALIESITFNRRVVGSTPALAAM